MMLSIGFNVNQYLDNIKHNIGQGIMLPLQILMMYCNLTPVSITKERSIWWEMANRWGRVVLWFCYACYVPSLSIQCMKPIIVLTNGVWRFVVMIYFVFDYISDCCCVYFTYFYTKLCFFAIDHICIKLYINSIFIVKLTTPRII